MGRAESIAALLPGSVSTVDRGLSGYQRGHLLEKLLALELEELGWRIVGFRQRCPYAEVDILASQQNGYLLMVEVKSLSNWDFVSHRLGQRQKRRLLNGLAYFQSRWPGPVIFKLAMIETNGGVTWFGAEVLG